MDYPYSFQDLVPLKDGPGRGPDFPEGFGFGLLADCRPANWGLYEYGENKHEQSWSPEFPVSDELAALIESGKQYPPALALARDDVGRMFSEREPTREAFAKAYGNALRNHLSRQQQSGFLLTLALGEEPGYLSKGEWYWVLSASMTDPVSVAWVSYDYYVYRNAAADFDLTAQQLDSLRDNKAF